MGKVAFVFSGQGAQYSGMGRELYSSSPAAAAVFDRLDALRPGTSRQCFYGSEQELSQTSSTQPCMFAVELAAAAALADAGVRCDMAAGFSLGEISALTYTGAVSLETGFRLVCLRGELMQREAEKADSGMAAILKMTPNALERICSLYEHVYPVNYNCPGQISVAGLREELSAFYADVKAAGGRAVPLKVAGAFHSPFMANAAEKFKSALEQVKLKQPGIPLFSDYTAKPYEGDYAELLSKQICSPVRWQTIVERMSEAGVDTFIEIGPGKTLCGLIAKTVPSARVLHAEDCASLSNSSEGARAC